MARTHQSLIWDRTRHVLRLRSTLREFFPAALAAFDDLNAPDALELLAKAPDPGRAARLSRPIITAALTRAHRRGVTTRTSRLQAILRAGELRQPPQVQAASGERGAVSRSKHRIHATSGKGPPRLGGKR